MMMMMMMMIVREWVSLPELSRNELILINLFID